jgi:hypothetical protein
VVEFEFMGDFETQGCDLSAVVACRRLEMGVAKESLG